MIDRMLFAEALETQKCFDEGVITTTADANIGSIMGIGFPPWTGGAAQLIVGYPHGARPGSWRVPRNWRRSTASGSTRRRRCSSLATRRKRPPKPRCFGGTFASARLALRG